MNFKFASSVVFVTVVLAGTALRAQSPVGLGGGGAMFAPALSPADPTLMFVACDMTGMYRSADGGLSWTMLNQRDVKGSTRFSAAFDPSRPNFVLGFHPARGLMQSVNGRGANGTWAPYPSSPPAGATVTAAAFSNESPSNLLVGTTSGLYNGVGQLQTLPQGASQDVLKIVWVRDPATAAQTPLVATSTGVYQRVGTTWTSTGSPSSVTDLAGGSDSTHFALYATFAGGGVSRYASNGATARSWQPVNSNGPADQCFPSLGALVGVSASEPDTAYATVPFSCSTAVYKGTFTLNTGTNQWGWTWAGVYHGFEHDSTFPTNLNPSGWTEKDSTDPLPGLGWGFGGSAHGFAVSPISSGTAMSTNFAAVHVTTDGGVSWGQRYTIDRGGGMWQTNGVDVTTTWNYYVKGSIRFIANTDIGLSRSVDGVQWNYVGPDFASGAHNAAKDWSNFYELAFDGAPGSTTVWAAVSRQHDIPHDTQIDDVHVTLGPGAVLVSTDDGVHWSVASDGTLPSGPVVSLVRRVESGAGVLYASVWRKGVFKSTPGASGSAGAWTRVGSFADDHVYQLRTNGPANDLYLGVALAITGFTPPPGAPPDYCSAKPVPPDCTPIYKSGGLYKLDPTSATWVSLTCATAATCVNPIAPMDFTFDPSNSNVIYMAAADNRGTPGKGGLWKIVSGSGQAPTQVLALGQVDPNPQNSIVAFAPAFFGGTLYVGTITHGVWQSADGGAHWSQALTNVPFLGAQRLVSPSTGQVFLTTFGGGVWDVTNSINPTNPPNPTSPTDTMFVVIMVTDPVTGEKKPVVLSF